MAPPVEHVHTAQDQAALFIWLPTLPGDRYKPGSIKLLAFDSLFQRNGNVPSLPWWEKRSLLSLWQNSPHSSRNPQTPLSPSNAQDQLRRYSRQACINLSNQIQYSFQLQKLQKPPTPSIPVQRLLKRLLNLRHPHRPLPSLLHPRLSIHHPPRQVPHFNLQHNQKETRPPLASRDHEVRKPRHQRIPTKHIPKLPDSVRLGSPMGKTPAILRKGSYKI